jgi:hypothetical protein
MHQYDLEKNAISSFVGSVFFTRMMMAALYQGRQRKKRRLLSSAFGKEDISIINISSSY